jgi:uncharacterized PurR-regulated membrane protein YhhQ (DUF165 family)
MLVALWLGAIVAANLIAAHYGPEATVYTAFGLVALTLVVRDSLHDRWAGDGRWWKMTLLIAAGGVLAYIASADAGRIAVASCIAFAVAESVDALVYHLARRWSWLERSNVSNVAGAAVDSILFPTIAFGGFIWAVTFGQFVAKVAGGVLFSILVARAAARQQVAA